MSHLNVDGDLEDGWYAMKDGSGRTFYVNDRLQKTQWDKPVRGMALQEGWVKMCTNQGRDFYVNNRLRVTQWDVPTVLPAGWAESVNNGTVFYVNHDTQVTTKYRPPPPERSNFSASPGMHATDMKKAIATSMATFREDRARQEQHEEEQRRLAVAAVAKKKKEAKDREAHRRRQREEEESTRRTEAIVLIEDRKRKDEAKAARKVQEQALKRLAELNRAHAEEIQRQQQIKARTRRHLAEEQHQQYVQEQQDPFRPQPRHKQSHEAHQDRLAELLGATPHRRNQTTAAVKKASEWKEEDLAKQAQGSVDMKSIFRAKLQTARDKNAASLEARAHSQRAEEQQQHHAQQQQDPFEPQAYHEQSFEAHQDRLAELLGATPNCRNQTTPAVKKASEWQQEELAKQAQGIKEKKSIFRKKLQVARDKKAASLEAHKRSLEEELRKKAAAKRTEEAIPLTISFRQILSPALEKAQASEHQEIQGQLMTRSGQSPATRVADSAVHAVLGRAPTPSAHTGGAGVSSPRGASKAIGAVGVAKVGGRPTASALAHGPQCIPNGHNVALVHGSQAEHDVVRCEVRGPDLTLRKGRAVTDKATRGPASGPSATSAKGPNATLVYGPVGAGGTSVRAVGSMRGASSVQRCVPVGSQRSTFGTSRVVVVGSIRGQTS